MRYIYSSNDLLTLAVEARNYKEKLDLIGPKSFDSDWDAEAKYYAYLIPDEVFLGDEAAKLFILYVRSKPGIFGPLFTAFGFLASAAMGNFLGAAAAAVNMYRIVKKENAIENADDVSKALTIIYNCYDGKAYGSKSEVELTRGKASRGTSSMGTHSYSTGGFIEIRD